MATAHYKQPWVLRSNPEFLMCNWKPPQLIGPHTGPVRRVFQTPRDGAPGFLSENTRSFLAPKYTYYASSLDTMDPPDVPVKAPIYHTAAPQTPVSQKRGLAWSDDFNDWLARTGTPPPPRHPVGPPPSHPPPPRGNTPTTPQPREHGGFAQHTGIQTQTDITARDVREGHLMFHPKDIAASNKKHYEQIMQASSSAGPITRSKSKKS